MLIENETYNNNNQNADENWNQMKYIIIRSGVVAVALTGIILNTIFGFALPSTVVDCVLDHTFVWTSEINAFFHNDTMSKYALLIISSLFTDLVFIAIAYTWISQGKSWRVFLALFTFYSFDIIMQLLFQIKIPDGYEMVYPGFPSIVVGYMRTTTMFYSGPIGFLMISTLEFWKINNFYLFAISLSTMTLQILTRNFLRADYIIDIFSAVVIAHYLFMLADEVSSKYLDNVNNEWFRLSNSINIKDIEYSDLYTGEHDNQDEKQYTLVKKDKKEI